MMQKYSVQFMPSATNDLIAIYDYIVESSQLTEVALSYIEKLEVACKKLEMAPIRGRNRDDIRQNLRIVALDKSAVAAFEVNETELSVTIFNIFYHGQDYETIMWDT